jgi:hypothetical protein
LYVTTLTCDWYTIQESSMTLCGLQMLESVNHSQNESQPHKQDCSPKTINTQKDFQF